MRTPTLLCAAVLTVLCSCGPGEVMPPPLVNPPPSEPGPGPAPVAAASPTWHQDVAPLVSRNCGGCHVAGGIAPFALTTYEQAKKMAAAIGASVASRRMPPWMPGGATPPLRHERKLTDAEIQVFTQWADAGGPEGDPATAAPLPPPDAPSFGAADLTFDLGADYRPDAQLSDDYRCFIAPLNLTQDQMAAAYRVFPGNTRTVHHVIIGLYSAQSKTELERLDAAVPGAGWTCFGGLTPAGSSAQQIGTLGAWVPGVSTVEAVPGTATRLPAGTIAVIQVHYNLAGGTDPDRTRVEVKYAPSQGAGLQQVLTLPMADTTLSIPPGAMGHVEQVSATAQAWAGGRFFPDGDAFVVGVAGHMHTLGRRFSLVKTSSAGAVQTLLELPAWDFHWQGLYQLQAPIRLVPGDVLSVECDYDNPGTQVVTRGEGTGDEMCIGYLQVVDNLPKAQP